MNGVGDAIMTQWSNKFSQRTWSILKFVLVLVVLNAITFGSMAWNAQKREERFNVGLNIQEYSHKYYMEASKIMGLNSALKRAQQHHLTTAIVLQQQKTQHIETLRTISRKLTSTLQANMQKFNDNVHRQIPPFMQWKKYTDQRIQSLNDDDHPVWSDRYEQYHEKLENAIDEATGTNQTTKKHAEVMGYVSISEFNLKSHANDPKLCTVMRQFDKTEDPKKIAEQIAFMNIGSVYCDQYYTKKSAWGDLTALPKSHIKNDSPYDQLLYVTYYEKYVKPKVAEAIRQYRDTKNNDSICHVHGINTAPTRDPESDALREAYLQVGQQYCSLKSQRKSSYFDTPIFCMKYADYFASGSNKQDLIERCKLTPGVLFRDEK